MIVIPIKGFIGWDVTANEVGRALEAANGAEVEFEIASGGGYVSAGLAIFNLIRNYPGKTTAKLSGYAMSMASYIPLAADRVVAEDNAVFMIHNARGGVFGDHNDIIKHGAYLKGLSGVIAKQYVKTTGTALEEITGMMDEETFFFGDEMVEAGFVDEIIESAEDNDDDQDSAVAKAKAAFEDVTTRMNADPAKAEADMLQAAAMMKEFTTPPAGAGKTHVKEVQQMTLVEMLSKDPQAAAEYEKNLADARKEGVASGQKAMQATIDKVAPFLASADYPPTVGKTALAVLKGTSDIVVLETAVATVDALREEATGVAAAEAAAKLKETPGEQMSHKDGGPTSSQEELNADIAEMKEG